MATQKRTLLFFFSSLLGVLVSTAWLSPAARRFRRRPLDHSRGLKVSLSDGRVLFEIPETGRIEALALHEEPGVLWTYAEGHLLSYDYPGRRLLALPVDTKGAYHHGRSKRVHLTLDPLDGSLWLA